MAKTKGLVSKKEGELRAAYQTYLRGERYGTATKSAKESHRDADTYYHWKKKELAKKKGKKKKSSTSIFTELSRVQAAKKKAIKEGTGR